MPYFLIYDDAFALKTTMIRPYSCRSMDHDQRVYNCSKTQRVVENVFGVLANRFQCLLTTIRQRPQTAEKIVLTYICLFNLMSTCYPQVQNEVMAREDDQHNLIPGQCRQEREMPELTHQVGKNRDFREAKLFEGVLLHSCKSCIYFCICC